MCKADSEKKKEKQSEREKEKKMAQNNEGCQKRRIGYSEEKKEKKSQLISAHSQIA
jgi:hypothetical protein